MSTGGRYTVTASRSNGLYTEIVVLGENDNLTLLGRSETIRVGDLLPQA